MKRRSVLASMGAFTASGSLVMGSGAFTSAEAERNVSIDIVGDPYAFLGLRYPNADGTYPEADPNATPPETLSTDGETNLFQATNQFAASIETFSVSVLSGNETFESVVIDENEPGDFAPGEQASVTIEVECNEDTTGKLSIGITASGDGFSVSAERAFTIECQAPPSGDGGSSIARFNGNGKFVFNGAETLAGKDLRAWYHDGNKIFRTAPKTANPSGNDINLNQVFGPQKSILAIEFDTESRYFLRNSWESDSCTFDGAATDATEKTESELCNEISSCSNTPSTCSS